jgi:hypothetical protein
MSFDLKDSVPSPNNWFQANIEYDGHGRAEFSDPKGTIEGHVKVNVAAADPAASRRGMFPPPH